MITTGLALLPMLMTAAPPAGKAIPRAAVWTLAVAPAAPFFNNPERVFLLFTVRNAGGAPGTLSVPWAELVDPRPFQVTVLCEGEQLDPAETAPKAAVAASTVRPGLQLTAIVPLTAFVELPRDGGRKFPAAYYVFWAGKPLGAAGDAHTLFEVEPATERKAADLTTPAGWLEPGKRTDAEAKQLLWRRMVETPDEPRWVAALRLLSVEHIDSEGLRKLAAATRDLGIRREAVRAAGRRGRDPELARALAAWVDEAGKDDPGLRELWAEAAKRLR